MLAESLLQEQISLTTELKNQIDLTSYQNDKNPLVQMYCVKASLPIFSM
jgi:hypothetical protein